MNFPADSWNSVQDATPIGRILFAASNRHADLKSTE